MDALLFRSGIDLFNRGEFFEAHEVLEDVWRAAPALERQFLQGLVQIAVAFHHHSTGNLTGAQSVLSRGCGNLRAGIGEFSGVRLEVLLPALDSWLAALASAAAPPPLPHIELLEQ